MILDPNLDVGPSVSPSIPLRSSEGTEKTVVPPSFSGSAVPRWRAWLMPAICVIVFSAEFGVVSLVFDVRKLLFFGMAHDLKTAAISVATVASTTQPSAQPPETAVKTEEPASPAPAAETSQAPAEAPLVGSSVEPVSPAPAAEMSEAPAEAPLLGSAVEPPMTATPATLGLMQSQSHKVVKVAAPLRHRSNTARSTRKKVAALGQVQTSGAPYALAEQIYQPGSRAPGW